MKLKYEARLEEIRDALPTQNVSFYMASGRGAPIAIMHAQYKHMVIKVYYECLLDSYVCSISLNDRTVLRQYTSSNPAHMRQSIRNFFKEYNQALEDAAPSLDGQQLKLDI